MHVPCEAFPVQQCPTIMHSIRSIADGNFSYKSHPAKCHLGCLQMHRCAVCAQHVAPRTESPWQQWRSPEWQYSSSQGVDPRGGRCMKCVSAATTPLLKQLEASKHHSEHATHIVSARTYSIYMPAEM